MKNSVTPFENAKTPQDMLAIASAVMSTTSFENETPLKKHSKNVRAWHS